MIRRLVGVLELGLGPVNLERMASEVSSSRNFRANHLESNLRPGAEAQFIHHAIQMSRQRLILQLQRPRPQLRSLHPFLQGVNIGPLAIDSTKELVLFFVNVGVPRSVAICHGLSICFDLGQILFHLVLLSLQPIPLRSDHASVQLNWNEEVETYPGSLPCEQPPEPPNKHGRVPHGPSRSIPRLVDDISIDDAPAKQHPHHCVVRPLLGTSKRL